MNLDGNFLEQIKQGMYIEKNGILLFPRIARFGKTKICISWSMSEFLGRAGFEPA